MFSESRKRRYPRFRYVILFSLIFVLGATGVAIGDAEGEATKSGKSFCYYSDAPAKCANEYAGKVSAGGSFCLSPPTNCS